MSNIQPKRRSLLLYLRLAIAVAILAIMLLPAEVWQAPANDFEASGFDRLLSSHAQRAPTSSILS